MLSKFRIGRAVLIYSAIFLFLSALHDYPRVRTQMHKVRLHDTIAERRQWLTFFYFVNEAGSGIKFMLTGNERYFAYFPSPSHLQAARLARALREPKEQ
ncbi:MAG: hypothetical protein K0U15_01320 [Proteobacteria bacterium]|nr:hypothetical protein [Pseudomonadota bacterium]